MRYRPLSWTESKVVKTRRSARRRRTDLEVLDQRQLLATFTVIDPGDDPLVPGTIAWAIEQSNATPGVLDTIEFDLQGFAPFRIALTQALPAITDAVVIDGTSQPGFNPTEPLPVVEIFGGFIPIPPDYTPASGVNGLVIETGLNPGDSSGTVIRGLAIGGFTGAGVMVLNSEDVTLQGNHIGVDSSGMGHGGAQSMMMNWCAAPPASSSAA